MAGPASAYTIQSFTADVFRSPIGTTPAVNEDLAAAHPNNAVIAFQLAGVSATDRLAELRVKLPAGLEAMPDDFPRCSDTQIETPGPQGTGQVDSCPAASQVGIQRIVVPTGVAQPATATLELPLYNMELNGDDEASRFSFVVPASAAGAQQRSDIVGSINDRGDYGQYFVTDASPAPRPPILSVRQTFWGTPGSSAYNFVPGQSPTPGAVNSTEPIARGQRCTFVPPGTPGYPQGSARTCTGPKFLSATTDTPFLTNPTTCGDPLTTTLETESATGDEVDASDTTDTGALDCPAVPFDGTAAFAPTGPTRDAPYAFGVNLAIPQDQDSSGRGQSQVKKVTATLPPGVTINPAAGNTIQACSDAVFDARPDSEAGPVLNSVSGQPACPAASNVGTASTRSPLTADRADGSPALQGNAWVGQPLPGDRYRLFVDLTGRGVSVRLKGSINANPDTGQLVATFDNQPQLPFDTLDLNLNGGPNGILAAPNNCDAQQGNVAFGPWSGNPDVNRGQTIQAVGCGGAVFAPLFSTSVGSLRSGAYSTLVTTIQRPDGQQFLRGVQVKLPKGALAQIKGQTQCSNAGAAVGICPAASRVGNAITQSGAGASPLPLNGSVYFTGPYKGAPYGLVTVVRAVAGPYDLGNVVVRQALNIDPRTTQVTVDSDPLPQVVGGIPLRLRTLRLDVNKGKFALNPTSCGPQTARGGFASAQGTGASRLAAVTLTGCKSLKFKPRLSLKLQGKGRFGDGDHPGLLARLRGLGAHGTSGLKRAQVILPKSLALDPDNAQSLCEFRDSLLTDPKCPAGSVVGYAKARTPILEKTLAGKVYFAKRIRTNSAGRQIRTLPQLVVALRGNGVKINLIGLSSVSKDRLVTTFNAPDAPVSAFDLRINGGKNGILVGNTSVCGFSKRSRAAFRGYNGALIKSSPTLGVSCGSSKKKK